MQRFILGLGFAALTLITVACPGTAASPGTPSADPSTPAGDEIVIVAKDLQFSPTTVEVPAGEPVTIVLDNQEAAPHNIAVKDASGAEVFKGEIGSSKQIDNAVPALTAGTYTFWCEVHPDMTGTITAS